MSNTSYENVIRNMAAELNLYDEVPDECNYSSIGSIAGITAGNIRQALSCAYIAGLIQGKNEPDYKLPVDKPIC